MIPDVFKTIIVPAELAPLARQLAFIIAGEAGKDMWSYPLSLDGNGPPTHYCSSGFISYAMSLLLTDIQGIVDASQGAVDIELATRLVTLSDVSDEEPFVAFARLNLKQIIVNSLIL